MIADTGFKGNSISLLEDGCPYFEFAEIVSEIGKEDQAAMSAMHDSVGNYDLDKIEKFISENYPDVAVFCQECTGGEWGYPLLECVEAQVDLRGDWRKDYDSKKGVLKNIDEIEKLIKDWKRSSIFNDHPVYDFLKTAISIFRENFNIHAENAACWKHGSDLIINSKFVGFGADAEELLMNFVNEQSWNEEIESIIITIEKPDLALPFIRNIALSEIMIVGLAAVFEQV